MRFFKDQAVRSKSTQNILKDRGSMINKWVCINAHLLSKVWNGGREGTAASKHFGTPVGSDSILESLETCLELQYIQRFFQVTTLTASLVIVYILFFRVENRCWYCRVCFMLSTINKMWPYAAFVYQSEAVSDALHCVWQLWSQPFVQYNNLILTVKTDTNSACIALLSCGFNKRSHSCCVPKLFSLDFMVV